MGILTTAFFEREGNRYFVPNDIIGFQLVGQEQKELSGRLAMQFTITLLLAFLTLAFGYDSLSLWLSPGTTTILWWIPNTPVLYVSVGVAWLFCWANSLLLWRTIKRRIAGRETRIDQACSRNGLVSCTRPFRTALVGLFVIGFLTQGFGGLCLVHDAAPICGVADLAWPKLY